MRIILLDDYNQRIPANQDIIGTVTTNWCEASIRHGWKIIEIQPIKNDKEMAKVYRIRKLSPLECHRLMGVSDEDFYKMKEAGISDSQLYKMAGNSIVVPVLEGIFTQLFRKDNECLF